MRVDVEISLPYDESWQIVPDLMELVRKWKGSLRRVEVYDPGLKATREERDVHE